MIKIALNGFGRIGKLALRRLFDNDISLENIKKEYSLDFNQEIKNLDILFKKVENDN